ncbi:MAG TPA: tubulin-like doman-containing protein [Gemmataceae bacterium]|nr:tubulin-like doman-containing protein [Gemmataceae bacterium]
MTFLREPDAEPLPGYRLIEPLGSGGFGEVWKCEAPGGLFKAIKFVFGNLNSLDQEGARAEQELKALQRIKEVRHPFVLSLDRIEVVGGELVIVMELADKSLYDLFQESLTAGMIGIPRDALLRYIRDAAEALDHMNEKHGLQHLDVKPRNLFLISDRCKVADFGLVKHCERQSGSGILGGVTPLYAPPETFSGKISGHSDQYSLAIVYQELLTGQRPFNGKNARQLAQQHLQEEPELRALPEAERPVVARALAKDPAKRFPNCLAFVRALYTARMGARPEVILPEPSGNRPKTMADTMENIQLEQVALEDGSPWPAGAAQGEPTPADGEAREEVSQLGITVAQPQTGALRPTVIIGLGSFGRRALTELRCRFIDRFGDLNKIPLLRFLYVDTDADAIRLAMRGSSEVAFRGNEVYHLPLQPIAHYRRRQLDQLTEWLPREKFYALPRSLKTQGSRALGRLAFADNYLRLLGRLRREVQQATHPDALYQSVSQTGLALRDSTPRIYVIAGAGGGSSGLLVDLGHALRRLLQQMRHHEAPVTAFLGLGAPEDPATPKTELANVYATLTELNHFSDPSVPFTGQYGADGPRLVDQGQPYECAYLLPMDHRTPEALRDVVAHLGSYLFHELTTPLGLRLDRCRTLQPTDGTTPFRSLGTYAIWFPRGLLLRLAARRACQRILEDWSGEGEPTAATEVEAAVARQLADPGLRPEALAAAIEEQARAALGTTPAEALTRLLATLEEQSQQSIAQDDPGNWARQALSRVQEWLGSGLDSARKASEWRKSKLNRALEAAAQKVAEEWDQRLAEAAFALMAHPGRRVAAAEAAIGRFAHHCDEAAAAAGARVQQQAARTHQAQQQLQTALANCAAGTGGFSWFGGRSARLIRIFVDHLAAFARQCLVEDLAGAVQYFYGCLHGRLNDRLRDLSFCRQRIRHVQQTLETPPEEEPLADLAATPDLTPSPSPLPTAETFWESIRQSATTRVVLPEDEENLETAAARFLTTLKPEHWTQLDQTLQNRVLGPLGGLQRACMSSSDLMRSLAGPLIEGAAEFLGEHLPITDVAQVEIAIAEAERAEGKPDPLVQRAHTYLNSAMPLIAGAPPRKSNPINSQPVFLLLPASDAGTAYGAAVQEATPGLELVRVAGQADLMFCREQGYLRVEDLHRVLRLCQAAYEEAATVPTTSPHARFDINDWLPLNP